MKRSSELFSAVSGRNLAGVIRAVERGAAIDEKRRGGMTPLMVAASLGELPILAKLLEYGANPNLKDDFNKNAITHARLTGQSEAVELLLPVSENSIRPVDLKAFSSTFGSQVTSEFVPLLQSMQTSTSARPGKVMPKKEEIQAERSPVPTYDLEAVMNKVHGFKGQQSAKKAIDKILAVANVNGIREARGLPSLSMNLHCLFLGSPGTGKTTFARLYAQACQVLGLLTVGHLVESSRKDFVAEYQGQTAVKTEETFKKALGGVLFIDEAYSLVRGKEDSYGLEAIDTLVKLIEDHRSNIIVILAGYESEMSSFLRTNPGLESRIPNIVPFKDYADKDLMEIFYSMAENKGFKVATEVEPLIIEAIREQRSSLHFGNARSIRNILEKGISNQSMRLSDENSESFSTQDLISLTKQDFASDVSSGGVVANTFLKGFVGLANVKKELSKLSNLIKVAKLRKTSKELEQFSAHMVFTGNPGVGKSSIARAIAKELYDIGFLAKGHLVEVDASDLIAGYQGQTALKTKSKLEEALGGVLFIDEAYALHSDSSSNSFGAEAIQVILKFMEDQRGKFILILAGYGEEMEALLQSNPGLQSRFPRIIGFDDYPKQDLLRILVTMASQMGFSIQEKSFSVIEHAISEEKRLNKPFSNARFVRNLLQTAISNQANRIAAIPDYESLDQKSLTTLKAEDFSSTSS